MRNVLTAAIAATALALSAGASLAGDGHGKGHGKHHARHGNVEYIGGGQRHGGARHCPPGLAKKHNGCNPPGQVKHRYNVGDRIYGDYIVIRRPDRYGLNPRYSYYRVGDYVYRVDRDTREVLDLIGAVAAILD